MTQKWIAVAAIAGVACGIYANTLRNEFVWDDTDAIVENYFIRNPANLPRFLDQEYFVLSNELSYRPLVTLTYFLDYALWGLEPAGYHFGNVLIHALTAVVFFLVLSEWGIDRRHALFAGLLFAAHPVTSEAVNVVAFREDIMAGLLMVLGMLAWSRASRKSGANAIPLLSAALLAYFAALLSKEMAATLPLLLVLRDWSAADDRRPVPFAWRALKRYAPFLLVLGLYLLIRFVIFKNPKEETVAYLGGDPVTALLTTSTIVATYVKLMFLPIGLSAQYDFPPVTWPLATDAVLSALLIGACLFQGARLLARGDRTGGFAIFAFFVALLPVANLIPIVNPAAERYLYVPCLFFCLFLAGLLLRTRLRLPLLVALLAAYGTLTVLRNRDWRDSETIWSVTARRHPNDADIRHELGDVHHREGRFREAIEEYLRALAIQPDHLAVRVNLGVCYDALGEPAKALEQYRIAAAIDPRVSKIHNNIGNVLFKQGKMAEAVEAYEEAIRLNPYYPEPHNNMATALLEIGQPDRALAAVRKALALAPDRPETLLKLARTQLARGDEQAAKEVFNRLLERGIAAVEVRYTLGQYYLSAGRPREAVAQLSEIPAMNPDEVYVHFLLAQAHERAGEPAAAEAAYERFLAQWQGDPAPRQQAEMMLRRLRGAAGRTE